MLRRRRCVCNLRRGSNDVGVAKSLCLTRTGINLPFVVSESYEKRLPFLSPFFFYEKGNCRDDEEEQVEQEQN